MALLDNPIRAIYVPSDASSGTLGTGGLIDVLASGTGTDPVHTDTVHERSANSGNWTEVYVGMPYWGIMASSITGGTNYTGTLDENLVAGDATITTTDNTGFAAAPSSIVIENEIIRYDGIDSGGTDLTGCTRGFMGTTDAAHDGTASTIRIYDYHRGDVLSIDYEEEPKVYGIRVKLITKATGVGSQFTPGTYSVFRFEIPEEHVTMVLYENIESVPA